MEQTQKSTPKTEEAETLRVAYVQMKEDFRLIARSCFSLILIFLGITGVAVRFLPDPTVPNSIKVMIAVVSIIIGCFIAIIGILMLRWLHHNEKNLELVCSKLGLPNDMSHTTVSKGIYLAMASFLTVVVAWIIIFSVS
jgi:hypothetical protein